MYDIILKRNNEVPENSHIGVLEGCNPSCYYHDEKKLNKIKVGYFDENGAPRINHLFANRKANFEHFLGEYYYNNSHVMCLLQTNPEIKDPLLQDIVIIGDYLFLYAANAFSDKFKKIGLNANVIKNLTQHIANVIIAPLLRNNSNLMESRHLHWVLGVCFDKSHFVLANKDNIIFNKNFRSSDRSDLKSTIFYNKYINSINYIHSY